MSISLLNGGSAQVARKFIKRRREVVLGKRPLGRDNTENLGLSNALVAYALLEGLSPVFENDFDVEVHRSTIALGRIPEDLPTLIDAYAVSGNNLHEKESSKRKRYLTVSDGLLTPRSRVGNAQAVSFNAADRSIILNTNVDNAPFVLAKATTVNLMSSVYSRLYSVVKSSRGCSMAIKLLAN